MNRSTRSAVIVEAVRTPVGKGKPGGALSSWHPTDLLAFVLQSVVQRAGIDAELVDDVIAGCVQQVQDQSGNIAHNAALAAGFPYTVPGTTINRQCGSSQQAAHFAAQGVIAGAYDVVIAAGVESMSRVPLGSSRPQASPRTKARFPDGLVNQGVSAELVSAKWGLHREDLDAFSAASHEKAARATSSGAFDAEVLPIAVNGVLARSDETVRPATTAEGLAGLRPAFHTEDLAQRFPQIEWSITPGNSSPLTDGASAMIIMSEDRAAQLNLDPLARFHAFSVVGDDPLLMLTGPIPATQKVLASAGMTIDDIDVYEVNEAFAPVPLAWAASIGADPDKLNPLGGAIALGHALGSSGTRLMTTMIHHMQATGARYGLQTMCEAGGMANATILERL